MAKTFLDYTGLTKVLAQLKSYIDAKWVHVSDSVDGYIDKYPSNSASATDTYYSPAGWLTIGDNLPEDVLHKGDQKTLGTDDVLLGFKASDKQTCLLANMGTEVGSAIVIADNTDPKTNLVMCSAAGVGATDGTNSASFTPTGLTIDEGDATKVLNGKGAATSIATINNTSLLSNTNFTVPESGSITVNPFPNGSVDDDWTGSVENPYIHYFEGSTRKSTILVLGSGSVKVDVDDGFKFSHKENTTAGSKGPTADTTLTSGGTFTVPYIQYNAEGHITSAVNRTMTMPTISASGITSASGTSPISADVTNNALTITHDASGVTGTNVGPTGSIVTTNGSIILIPYIEYNSTGHITRAGNRNITMPSTTAQGDISATEVNNDLVITHNTSGVTGENVGPTENATLSSGGTFTVPYLTYNTSGHITGVSNRTMTMPTIPAAVTDYIPKSGGTLNSGAALTFTDGGKYLKGDSTNSGLVTDGRMTATSFYESSDANLKENIQAPTVSAEDVEIKEFNFKGEDNTKYGVIAQQVQEAGLENLVLANDEGVLAVDYISLSMLMISDLRKQVAELKAEIAELKK